MSLILDRIDAALERMRWRYPERQVKCIYFTEEDWAEFDTHWSEVWGSKIHCFSYGDIDIRRGEQSRVVNESGCHVNIPKRLSPKVAA